MNAYSGTLGLLVIVEFYVFVIWLKVLLDSVRGNDNSLAAKRVLLTAIGLVLNAASIAGIMTYRVWELIQGNWPFVWGIVAFYILLAAGNILFIVAASIGRTPRLLQTFVVTVILWALFVAYTIYI